ncbi:Potassium channel KAT1 [Intoshia linei]|uniref:Potassium channel KAT1 n=1 Tax=Intoshia linei TaxID=1819745 RepID=A0A177AZE0_9BILA|nr:Potassium channel KAT1 [Intoshia linei]
MLIMLIANMIILPVYISFFNDDFSINWLIFNGTSDLVFLLDLIINFRTGIIGGNFADEIILDPKKIAKRYVTTWFALDLISSIPVDYVMLYFNSQMQISQLIYAGRAIRFFRLVKLLSLLRLLRLSRLVRYIGQWEEFLSIAIKMMRLLNLVALMLILGHWNGCLQWLVPMLQGFPSSSWVSINELENSTWTEKYTWSLFKALSHMLCIGYGKFPPQNMTDLWLTIISMLIGATCYALFIGHATSLIQSFDTSKRQYRDKIKQVEEYMIYRKIPRRLRDKISDYYCYRYQGKMFNEKEILCELSECLREEVVNFNCRALVGSVPFFTHANPEFVSQVIGKLDHEVFQPNDFIIKVGTLGKKMYFIQEGIVDIITSDNKFATSLSDGSYFGEICLLTNARRVASVRAATYCNLFSLSVENFNDVLKNYPLMRRTLESVAAQRLNKIGKNPTIVNSKSIQDDINVMNHLFPYSSTLNPVDKVNMFEGDLNVNQILNSTIDMNNETNDENNKHESSLKNKKRKIKGKGLFRCNTFLKRRPT